MPCRPPSARAASCRADTTTATTVPDYPRPVALCNVLVRAYATVNDKLVWGVVDQHLIPLCERMRMLLGPAATARQSRGMQ